MLDSILYSAAVGLLLLAGYLFRSHHLELFRLKTTPSVIHWFNSFLGSAQGTLLEADVIKQTNAPESFSNEWWQDDGIFQLEKRGIFSKVRGAQKRD
jgi:hypothetical protein